MAKQQEVGVGPAPRTLTWATFVLAIAGLGVSAYLTYEHFTGSKTLACPDTGKINCAKVTTSSYSHFLGMPVALLGLLFFVVLVVIMSPWAWTSTQPLVRPGRWVVVVVGLLSVVYLVWAELYKVDAICLFCTSVHVITFLIFVLTLFAEVLREPV